MALDANGVTALEEIILKGIKKHRQIYGREWHQWNLQGASVP